MALLTAAVVSRAGVDVVGVAADVAGDTFVNTGLEYAEIKNGSGAGITVTLDFKPTVDGQAVADPTVSIGAGVTKMIGPFPPGWYNDGLNQAKITYSAITSVTIKLLKMAPA